MKLDQAGIDAVMRDALEGIGLDYTPGQEMPKPNMALPYSATVYTDVVYARSVEYGTRPSADANKSSLKDICADKDNKQF
jgi:hypothetical protein